jgi:hypothetical protein
MQVLCSGEIGSYFYTPGSPSAPTPINIKHTDKQYLKDYNKKKYL